MKYTKKQKEFIAVKHNRGGVYEYISKHPEGVTLAQIMDDLNLTVRQACGFINILQSCSYVKKCDLALIKATDTDKSIIYGLRKKLKGDHYTKSKRKKKLIKVLYDAGDFTDYDTLIKRTGMTKRELINLCAEGVKIGIIHRSTDKRGRDPLFKLNKIDQPKQVRDCSEIRHEMESYRKNTELRNLVNLAFGVAHA